METKRKSEKLVAAIEQARDELVELCLLLGNVPSPHGKERVAGEAVLKWLKRQGIDGQLQFITEESVNAVATVPGTGTGPSLIYNAHMDTGPELSADASEDAKKLETAWTESDMLFGSGMINDKAQLCAFMIAMAALKRAEINLGGDLT